MRHVVFVMTPMTWYVHASSVKSQRVQAVHEETDGDNAMHVELHIPAMVRKC